jgi:signal transduction histidine kinase
MTSIADEVSRGRRFTVRRWVPYSVLAITCALTALAGWYVSATMAERDRADLLVSRARFVNDAEKTRQQIEVRLNTYLEVIRAGAALMAANHELTPFEFRAFVAGLDLPERFPGMQAMGFAQRVSSRSVRSFRRMASLDGITRLRRWNPEGSNEYFPVVYLEPRRQAAQAQLALEMSSDPVISEAMDRARDMGQPAISGKLAGDSFIVLAPVYRLRAIADTVEQRRDALVGFVFSPFSALAFLGQIVSDLTAPVTFEVYDGTTPNRDALLGDAAAHPIEGADTYARSLRAGGREWLVMVSPKDAPASSHSTAARWTLLVGLAISLLLFFVTYEQVRAWEQSAKHEAELRASEQALRKSEAAAQAAGRTKDEFLATLSHELRTPLNAILGWVSLLRLGAVEQERRDHVLGVIERNARLQADLIEDLLDISHIVMGKVRLRLHRLDLSPVVTAAVESLRPGAEAKGIELRVNDTVAGITIRGDAERLQQIMWNLVSNAIKFTPAGGKISIDVTSDATHAHLSVRDTGIGIAPDFLPHVFERFRQADSSSTRTHAGLGLGLAIVQNLVALHGGSIDAHSEGLNQGTEFRLHFPLAGTTDTAYVPLVMRQSVAPDSLNGVRVLVVDDDAGTRDLLSEALSATGTQVVLAPSASDALRILTTSGADVIVSDIAMPDQDGLALMRQIRSLPGELGRIPAIALTALARASDRDNALAAGFQTHFAKPVELSMLQAEIARLAAGGVS